MDSEVQSCFNLLCQYVLDREIHDIKRIPFDPEILRRAQSTDREWLLTSVNKKFHGKQDATLLHFASEAGRWNSDIVRLLIDIGANPEVTDAKNRTPLHWTVGRGCHCDSCNERAETCVKMLLNMNKVRPHTIANIQNYVFKEDDEKRTALDLAVQNMYCKAAAILLDVSKDTVFVEKKKLLRRILKSMPSILLVKLDRAISLHYARENGQHKLPDEQSNYASGVNEFHETPNEEETQLVIHVDFSFLTQTFLGNKDFSDLVCPIIRNPECEFLVDILRVHKSSREKIFTHPVMEAFLQRKWQRVKWIYGMFHAIHLIFCCFYTHYTFVYYLQNCPYRNVEENDTCETWWNMKLLARVLLAFSGLLIIFQSLNFIISGVSKYFSSPGLVVSWWIFNAGLIITTLPAAIDWYPYNWMHALAAFVLFESWALILGIYARVPLVGTYIDMYLKVRRTIIFCVGVYGLLVVAFAFGFHVMFPENREFGNVYLSFVKLLTMMIGDTDYEGLFEDSTPVDVDLSHVFYSGFNILVTIIFMNLLIGLSVSDIQMMKSSSKITGISRQVTATYGLERMLYGDSNKTISRVFGSFSILRRIQDFFNVCTESKCYIAFRPYDPNDRLILKRTQFQIFKLYKSRFHWDSVHNLSQLLKFPDIFETPE